MKRPRAIDLFCGAGGMSLGLEAAGFDLIAGMDIDPIHAATHYFNFPYSQTICSDIRNFQFEEEVELISFGSPCQGFSLIGNQDQDDPRNQLSFEAAKIIFKLRPRYFLMENVKAIANSVIFSDLIDQFKSNGYKVVEPWQVLSSEFFGVPQKRQRLFLLGYRNDQLAPKYPRKGNASYFVQDAIADLEDVTPFLSKDQGIDSTFLTSRGRYPLVSPETSNSILLDNCHTRVQCDRVWGHLASKHTQTVQDRFAATLPGNREAISRFYKLDPFALALTLRAGTPANKGSHTAPRPIHPKHPRCITAREAARLHGYPDWYQFHRSIWHSHRQIGNSVPPPLAFAIGAEIIKCLGGGELNSTVYDDCKPEALLKFSNSEAARFWNVDPLINGKRSP